jgi:hypothetical protein
VAQLRGVGGGDWSSWGCRWERGGGDLVAIMKMVEVGRGLDDFYWCGGSEMRRQGVSAVVVKSIFITDNFKEGM